MTYDFDRFIDRKGTNSIKHDFLLENGFSSDTIPLWVADMDFSAPIEVIERMKDIAQSGIYGYSDTKSPYFDAVHDWFSKRYDLDIEEEWLIKTPGVVFAVAAAVRAFSEEGDGILIQRPVYYPFERLIKDNKRKVVNSPLVYKNGRYRIDFDDFERALKNENVKVFILCSPHNPVGRVWTKEELTKMGELCLRYQVKVIADEIHCDFTYGEHHYTSFAAINQAFAQNSVICTSPSKTFNLAGIQVANIFVPNKVLRQRLKKEIAATGFGGLNIFGLAACETAYRFGDEWLSQLKAYLMDNSRFVQEFIRENLPKIHLVPLEGTYLIWLDFSRFALEDNVLEELIRHQAKLWLSSGTVFGEEGKHFQRLNIACPHSCLEEAFVRLKQVFGER